MKLVEQEKSLIDYHYLNTNVNSTDHIEEMRLNLTELNEHIGWQKVDR